jgi:hypothetical protein
MMDNELQNLVRLFAKLQIKPAKFSVVTPNNQMVARWVNVHGRNPFNAGRKGLQ